jgi:hypothetical protein
MTAHRTGFDGFVGNPPFLGGRRISTVHGARYKEWLAALHDESNGNSDIVAHFYRRTFGLLRANATFGLLATNTIAQGDTRATGLGWICSHGGVIYDATKRYKWKGPASVVTSIVHVQREPGHAIAARLNGSPVERVSAFLFHEGGDVDPAPLLENANLGFVGCYILGMGFTFDDANEAATPLAEMRRLLAADSRNLERVLPYLGGDELNSSPTQAHRRHVINFGGMSEDEARSWPDLFSIVETKVKPQRLAAAAEVAAFPWWQFWNARRHLYETIRPLDRVLAIARVSDSFAATFVPAKQIFSEQIAVFAFDTPAAFAILQSRVHELWARFLASTMGDGLRYGITDCFETFPFPAGWRSNSVLETAGRVYDEFRAELMVRNGEGLTATYRRFHDPNERGDDIVALRGLHDALDHAVLNAYGWGNESVAPEFLASPRDEDDGDAGRTRHTHWRYRWRDDERDGVLARVLALNAKRAATERLTADVASKQTPRGPRKAVARANSPARKRAAR